MKGLFIFEALYHLHDNETFDRTSGQDDLIDLFGVVPLDPDLGLNKCEIKWWDSTIYVNSVLPTIQKLDEILYNWFACV